MSSIARLTILTLTLLAHREVSAAGPSTDQAAADAAKVKARGLVTRAAEAFRAGRFADAGADYLQAHDVLVAHQLPTKPELLYNAAFAFDRAGRCVRAAELYARFVELDPKAVTRSPELSARIEQSRACAPEVTVASTPSGASVTIDGVARGTTPLALRLEAGDHAVALALPGHEGFEGTLTVERGRSATFTRTLAPRSAPTVAALPRDDVGGAVHRDELRADVDAPAVSDRTWVWVSGGAGAVALTAAVVLRALSMSAVDDYEAELSRQLALPSSGRSSSLVRDGEDRAVAYEVASNVSLGLAVVGLGAAVYLWATAPSPDAPSADAPSTGSSGLSIAIDPTTRTAGVVLPW
ncbi:PEGA domain-containing protein [Myxococcota bacterium]|nr:PEGA domain-containing protein [Myxococcota bacterium]